MKTAEGSNLSVGEMREYSDAKDVILQELAWSDSAWEVLKDVDLQEAATLLDFKLGSSASQQLLPAIRDMKTALDKAIGMINYYTVMSKIACLGRTRFESAKDWIKHLKDSGEIEK